MNILWIVNTIFPEPAKKFKINTTNFGGWLTSLYNNVISNEKIQNFAIVTTYDGDDLKKFKKDKTFYYLIPCKNRNAYYDNKIFWEKILKEFNPNLVHIHGTEFPLALSFLNNNKSNIKVITSIQGLLSECSKKEFYYGRMKKYDILKNITLRDIYRKDILLFQSRLFKKRSYFEKKIINKSNLLLGRTSWDKFHTYKINSNVKYMKLNEILRKEFYNNNWDISKIKRHSIFINQAYYPLKGFHNVICGLKMLKDKYPDLSIKISGNNIIKDKKILQSGYGNYIYKLLKKNNLINSVKFVGLLSELEIIDALKESNVYLQTSSLENSSNSLGEAMILGVPSVASFVGGTNDIILDKEEGFLYDYRDPDIIYEYISDIFDNDELALKLSKNAKRHAEKTHSINNNVEELLKIYEETIGEEK